MFKDLDRTSILVIAICIILILSWNHIFGPKGLNLLPQQQHTSQQVTEQVEPSNTEIKPGNIQSSSTAKSQEEITSVPEQKETQKENVKQNPEFKDVLLTNPNSSIDVKIDPNTGSIASILLKDIKDSDKKHQVILNKDVDPGALTISGGHYGWTLEKVYPPIEKNHNELILKRKFKNISGNNFLVEQDWKLNSGYVIDYSIRIYNLTNNNITFPEIYVWAGGIPPIEYLSGDIARSEAHRIDSLQSENNNVSSIKVEDKHFPNDQEINTPVKWLAVSDKYFANILKPISNDGNFYGGIYTQRKEETTRINNAEKNYYVASAAGIIKNTNINPNSNMNWDFKFYAGPKEIKLLGAFAPQAKDILHLAFTTLETISQYLLYFLIFLKGIVGSYGWAIILLTVIVKLVFWPITHKSNVSMKKMQKIQPKMKELREKYKNDKQLLNTKMMELYKKEGVNPLGGCLPILVQIPVFFALYWTLDGAIELRHASFLWAKDLTQPDTIGHLFGIPINPLAILMALTMLVQQKLTPTATDPTQAKMMLLMPIVMLVFLYNLPSGLTLYWTVSQIISIIQLLVNIYKDKQEKHKTNLKTA